MVVVWSLILLVPLWAHAQDTTSERTKQLRGLVVDQETEWPLAGALLIIGREGPTAITDARGRFSIRIPGGNADSLHVRLLGYRPASIAIQASLLRAEAFTIRLVPSPIMLDGVTVSATREARDRSEIPMAVDRIGEDDISRINPAHPSRIANRIPGVWINATEGEGHMTAIRQPLSLLPQYLYLENGIPTRSTGFFNHNALFEVNIPQASAIEIIKGPGSALYGSDAIGGVINVETGAIPARSGGSLTAEGGSFGFKRMLATAARVRERHALRADVNWTTSDGWRRGTEYDRQSATLSWQRSLGQASRLRTVATWTRVEQHPAGIAAISTEDYLRDPRTHYTPISYRNVTAVRVSSSWERWSATSLWTVTPFFRYSRMDLIPNWALSFDPAIWETFNWSIGAQARFRKQWPDPDIRWIAGLDLDMSPGERIETGIIPDRVGSIFVDYQKDEVQYDYGVTYAQAAPFTQIEWQVTPALRLSSGLRLDLASYNYDNRLSVLEGGSHQRPPSQRIGYRNLSPKTGLVYRPLSSTTLFASWRHAFRVPSERQVFRQGAARSSIGLKPVRADNLEAGVRWQAGRRAGLELTAFSLRKENDIVTFNYPDGSRGSVNTGETRHEGLETGIRVEPLDGIRAQVAWTLARHEYRAWITELDQDFSGNEMELAPRHLVQAELAWTAPFLEGVELAVELHRVGSYWMNPENTVRYDGHHLFHARIHAALSDRWTLMGRVGNITDERYAQRALTNAFRGDEWAPGLPRSFNLALKASL